MRRSLAALPLLALAGRGYQAWASARDRQRYPPPGRLVDIGEHSLHLLCQGEGGPPVIFEAGLPGMPTPWLAFIQPEVARLTMACSYDRAGIGWSEPSSQPRTARQIAHELHRLLEQAEIPGPYILVGTSFGGHFVRLFTHLYPDKVAGLLLLDASHERMAERMPPAQQRLFPLLGQLVRLFSWLAPLGILRLALPPLWSVLGLPRTLQSHLVRAAYWRAAYAEVSHYQESERQLRAARQREPMFGDLPLIVLTTLGHWQSPTQRALWLDLQRDLLALSSNSTQRIYDELAHTDLLRARGVGPVVGAVEQLLAAVRAGTPLA